MTDHMHIQKLFLLYLDKALSEQDTSLVHEHLAHCPSCQAQLESLSALWRAGETIQRVPPPLYLWTRIEARARASTQPQSFLAGLQQRFVMFARPAFMLATLVFGLILGAYLGNIPADIAADNGSAQMASQEEEDEALNPEYLESFSAMPPESVGQAYMLAADEQGGGR